ncbi:hypothetical protein [Terrisporobacter mayombei]|uniref:hypothetical protein n=1 Tax=Terrisporobacter mayombei TaxID=1541 RepID=UPI00265A806E|nr:hypothetical protein [Terrisporobacter mayombei]MCC3668059.1 hypothetical protein [Terrisporobacter mayombei]
MVKLKARAVKNRLNKYNIYAEVDGQFLPVGRTINEFEYSLLEWPTKEEVINHILEDNRLELVD